MSFPIFTGPPFLFTCVAFPIYIHRGTHTPGHTPKVKNVFRFKLDAKSVPEALATTIRILLMFSIVLAHPWGSRGIGPPHPSGTPHRHPWAPPEHPWLPLVPMGPRAGGTPPEFRNPNNNPIIVSILPRGAEFGLGGEGGPSHSTRP